MLEPLFTPEQIADSLQLHHLTVLNLIKRGELAAIKIGRVYRIKESAVNAYLEANTIQAAAC